MIKKWNANNYTATNYELLKNGAGSREFLSENGEKILSYHYRSAIEQQKYKVTFVLNNGEENIEKMQAWGTIIEEPSGVGKEGYKLNKWIDEEIDTNGTIEIFKGEKKIEYLTKDKDKLAETGNKIVITLNDERIEYIVVIGDLNGDGVCAGQGDLLKMARMLVVKI